MNIRDPLPYLFYNIRTKQPLQGDAIRKLMNRIAAKHSIEGKNNPHGWRHLFAELYSLAGGQIPTLSKLMGHESTSVTADIYLNFAVRDALEDYKRRNPMQQVRKMLENKKPLEQED